MATYGQTREDRLKAVLPTAMVVGALGWGLIAGLAMRQPAPETAAIETFDVSAPPPVLEKSIPPKQRSHRREGAAAPPNLRATATEVVAPPPVVVTPVPPPLPAAPVANVGSATWQGAAPLAGPGTGAGGIGNGFGSGGDGDGDGGGAGETPPRRTRGRIKDSDFPHDARDAGAGGVVGVRYFVEVNGRATHCEVTHSSGNGSLDATTCRLIEERFRYKPSLDAGGRPVRSVIVMDNEWVNELEPPPPDRQRGR